ncbi:MAG TPA: FAD-dependent oxidoreductase [Solirubrobacteraceae bacterium]|jgi:FAD/FMN-containing dehydrogenase
MVIDTLHFHPIEELGARLAGELIGPDSADYDAARRVFNGAVDRRPAAIVRPVRVADVQAAVRWARGRGLPIAVRGGGTSPAGDGVTDAGVVIDLSRMREVLVDAAERTVRVGGGATWGEVDAATQAFGLATPGARVPDVGVAGFVLSGGRGWLSSAYGSGADNLVEAVVVTADGDVVRTGGELPPGVVVELTLRLHPVGEVLAGRLCFDAAHAEEALALVLASEVPDTVALTGELVAVRGEPMAAIGFCSFGADGEAALADLRALEPVLDTVARRDYASFQASTSATNPAGLHSHWASRSVGALPAQALAALVANGLPLPSVLSEVQIVPLGGRILVTAVAKWAYPAPAVAAAHRRWADELVAGLEPWALPAERPQTDDVFRAI